MIKDLGLDFQKSEKLVLTLEDKSNYVVPITRTYSFTAMRLKKVHQVIELDQEPWMEPYIRMNTEFRREARANSRPTSTN